MTLKLRNKSDKESCPLYEDYLQLKNYAEENRNMIMKNHLEVVSMIEKGQLSHETLSKSVYAIHEDLKTIVHKIEKVQGLFVAWTLLPNIARSAIKILLSLGGLAIAVEAIINFIKLFIG